MIGFAGPPGVFARPARPARCADRCAGRGGRSSTAPFAVLTISSLTTIPSVKSILTNSSELRSCATVARTTEITEEPGMTDHAGAEPNRLDRRKARTRAALIHAAQAFIAAGRTNVPILEITQAADVGMGSFYNHFQTKDELFHAAVEDALDAHGARARRAHRRPRRPRRGLRPELPAHRPPAPPRARTEQGVCCTTASPGRLRTRPRAAGPPRHRGRRPRRPVQRRATPSWP